MRKYLLYLAVAVLTTGTFIPASGEIFTGSLRSDYYMYQDANENDRYVLMQSFAGETSYLRAFDVPWKFSFSGEFRDSNNPGKGIEDARLTALFISKQVVRRSVDVRFGRFLAKAGGFSPIDGIEIALPKLPVKTTVAFGYERYPIYGIDAASLLERTRAAARLEGIIPKGPFWFIDHATRLKDSEVDDQITTLGLRCRRLKSFGWDARIGYDSKESTIRDFRYGLIFKPTADLQLKAQYSQRRYRVYQDSFFGSIELEPTQLVGIQARYALRDNRCYLGLGYDRRLREEGDLDRISASLSHDFSDLGVRFQNGENMGQFGAWINAYGEFLRRFNWGVAIAFDQWDSAWDTEPAESWANSATLGYELSPQANLEGRVEQFQTGEVDSDIRGLLTFKFRFGL